MVDRSYANYVNGSTAYQLPNLLEQFDLLKSSLKEKKLFIFLDYDGTLTPIVSKPSDALLSDDVRLLLLHLASIYIVGVVTGRAMQKIKQFVRIEPNDELQFYYIASHGFRVDHGCADSHLVGQAQLPKLQEFSSQIRNDLSAINKVYVEDNEFAVSIHYRNAAEQDVQAIESLVDQVLTNYPMLKKTYGKKVFEIRLNIEWDKGRAILWLLKEMGYSLQDDNIALIYIGDDITDEDAFRALKICPNVLNVLVSSECRPTEAALHLKDTEQVHQFLRKLLTLKDTF